MMQTQPQTRKTGYQRCTRLSYSKRYVRSAIVKVHAKKDNGYEKYESMMSQWTGKVKVIQVAPAVRVAVSEGFNMPPGRVSSTQLVTALKQIGFEYVFDTVFSADVTIVEEANELMGKLVRGELNEKPMFTSCCPGWIQLVEKSYPEVIACISTTKSPQMIMGSIVKRVFSRVIGVEPSDILMASCMPCVRKQGEADRPQFTDVFGVKDVDYVFTTQDIIDIFKHYDIDMFSLPETQFDNPLGIGSGAGVIFGKTQGVMGAALRYVYLELADEHLRYVSFKPVEGRKDNDIMEASLWLTPKVGNRWNLPTNEGPINIRVAIVTGLGAAKQYLKGMRSGEYKHHFVEVMACPAGCISGAGQPAVGKNKKLIELRKEAINALDEGSTRRCAQENEGVKELYEQYVGHHAEELFHTSYERSEGV